MLPPKQAAEFAWMVFCNAVLEEFKTVGHPIQPKPLADRLGWKQPGPSEVVWHALNFLQRQGEPITYDRNGGFWKYNGD